MQDAEFNKLAENYSNDLSQSISFSGYENDYFSEYKIRELKDLSILRNSNFSRILDFGSGIGSSIPWFRKYFSNSEITCADKSTKSIEESIKRFPGKELYLQINDYSIPCPENYFDLVFCACVFHHIPLIEFDLWLHELHRVSTYGGTIVIYEHNPFNPLTLYVVNRCPLDKNANLISSRKLSHSLNKNGWYTQSINYHLFFPKLPFDIQYVEKRLKWLPLGAQYSVIATK